MEIIRYVVMDDAGNYLRGKSWYTYKMVADLNEARLFERRCDASNSKNIAENKLRRTVAVAKLTVLRMSFSLNRWDAL